jgi:antitoxin (DNA-binding transcriptional repressor) of toxin-antitoxin stability system
LDKVKGGEEVIVTDRGHAVARVVPYTRSGPTPAEYEELIRRGIIRPAKRKPTPDSLRMPRVADPEGLALKALLEEREGVCEVLGSLSAGAAVPL